jgi:hypothetical protein
MGINLKRLLSELYVGEPVGYRKVRLHPLQLKSGPKLDYQVLGDKNVDGLVSLEETTATGTVSRLRVRNGSNQCVFILDGTTLTGSKQNRVVNLSVLLAPQSVTDIPVSCVERGRWWYTTQTFSPSTPCDIGLRSQMCIGTTASLKRSKEVHIDQGQVWSHVDKVLGAAGACSATGAYHAAFANWDETMTEYHEHLPFPEGASGVAVEIDGGLEVVDLFDRVETLAKLWPRLVRSYSVAAINPFARRGSETCVRKFLDEALSGHTDTFQTVGIGTTARLETSTAVGAALLFNDGVVHLSLFANGAARSAPDRVVNEAERRRRPWWRLWR